MQIVTVTTQNIHALPKIPAVFALGFFDGVHRGHQQVIATASRRAQAAHLPLAVMTFDRHASTVFDRKDFFYLTTVEEKAALMAALGVDILYVVTFTREFAALSPQAFVDDYLVALKAQVVVAGFDYTYGQDGIGTMAAMPGLAAGRFAVQVVAKLVAGGQKVSSTRIRNLIKAGHITAAECLLGHPYQHLASVVA